MSTLFGMVTVGTSASYTKLALASFFQHTKLLPSDSFLLVDNDGAWTNDAASVALPAGQVMVNPVPLNFSENVNQLIQLANTNSQDLCFLSNDVVFTPHWYSRLVVDDSTVSIPSCNQTHDIGFKSVLNINDFGQQFGKLNTAAHIHHAKHPTTYERLLMPFYVFRLSRSTYETVGPWDETFHMGGEDVDYRLRCLAAGLDVKYTSSLLLHFNGASTWNGTETPEQTQHRNHHYYTAFKQKYGPRLTKICIDVAVDSEDYNGLQKDEFNKFLLEKLHAEGIAYST